jgi:hypothetical protein
MPIPFISRQKTLEELSEENERLKTQAENEDLKLTIAQKRALQAKLSANGLSVNKTFGGSLRAAWRWAMQPIGGKKSG